MNGKRNKKVLGLAWVSRLEPASNCSATHFGHHQQVNGMCKPTYSCTLNEGKSFEAAFVIAHEMAHRWVKPLGPDELGGKRQRGHWCVGGESCEMQIVNGKLQVTKTFISYFVRTDAHEWSITIVKLCVSRGKDKVVYCKGTKMDKVT